MPEREYRTGSSTSTSSAETSSAIDADLQDTLGNEALAELIAARSAGSSETEVDGLWEEASAAQEVQKPELIEGSLYTILAADMTEGSSSAWRTIACSHGMSEDVLIAFNQHILSVQAPQSEASTHPLGEAADIATGVQIYIPSADEILFKQCASQSDSMAETVELWGEMASSSNLAIIRSARERASGKVGIGYGTPGDEGIFYSPNPDLVGASSKRSEVVNGNTEYRVNWGSDFWKCSVFLHDVVYSAGYVPSMTENEHYTLAGQLQWSDNYEEVAVQNARPGDCWQRFGGTRSDESHNAILSSFVERESVDEESDSWTFSIIGAENKRAAESERSHTMKKGTNENIAGKLIRFFRPKAQRSTSS